MYTENQTHLNSHELNDKLWDVLVIGAGNAGLCAAICAVEAGCSTLVIEAAPQDMRGGNTRHTRNLRAMHEESTDFLSDSYSFDEYFEDLMRVTKGVTNKRLAKIALTESADLPNWLAKRGVRFQPALSGTLNLDRTNAFFLGGGRTLLNHLCHYAATLGVKFRYESSVEDITIEDGCCSRVSVAANEATYDIQAHSVVFAAGGFEANLDWLAEGWGEAAKNFLVRGTPYNTGTVLRCLLDAGVQSTGELDQCHAVAIDARAPKFDGGIVSRIDAVPFSIVLNRNSERFYDEGEDFWPKRYAVWGRLVANQPEQTAFAIVDCDAVEKFMPSVFPPLTDQTIKGLASQMELDPGRTKQTVDDFNAACPEGLIDPSVLDGKTTTGLHLEKTNWAAPIKNPPFYGYPLKPGITFTYMGVTVNEQARIMMADDRPSANMFAAGEIMAGNILGQGYLAGIGMTIGGVFGRLAGQEAARVLNR